MEILLKRKQLGKEYTTGSLSVGETFSCATLEPRCIDWNREQKINGHTAIPAGRYRVMLQYSNRYRKLMPFLQNVPHFVGVMIHTGNTVKDTQGCILVGATLSPQTPSNSPLRGRTPNETEQTLSNSRSTFDALYKSLMFAHAQREEIWITIE